MNFYVYNTVNEEPQKHKHKCYFCKKLIKTRSVVGIIRQNFKSQDDKLPLSVVACVKCSFKYIDFENGKQKLQVLYGKKKVESGNFTFNYDAKAFAQAFNSFGLTIKEAGETFKSMASAMKAAGNIIVSKDGSVYKDKICPENKLS